MKPIFLLGEAYGENEARIKRGFVGFSGLELLRMLNEAGIIVLTADDYSYIQKFYDLGDPKMLDCIWEMHPEVYRSNVFNQRPPDNKVEWFCGEKVEGIPGYPAIAKSKYVRKEYQYELDRLGDELLNIDPNLVICLGNSSLWALGGTTGISKLRGTTSTSSHTVSGYKLLPTYHPAAVLRQWELRPTVVMDLIKAKREAIFPEVRRPACTIWIEPTIADMEKFYGLHIANCKLLSVDIETAGSQITCIGFSPSASLALVVPFLDERRPNRSYWNNREDEIRAWGIIRTILEDASIKKTFQNGLYDIAFTLRSIGTRTLGAEHDTMLLHHALQPESLKSLGFLGSIYTDHGPWKSERKGSTTIKRDE